jgi:acyl-CoA thioester hydrolase
MISETYITVRYAETDQMGIAHHSHYPVWFEAGRTDLIKKMGISYGQLEKDGLMLPLIELTCKYKSYCKYEDKIVVQSFIKNITFTRITFGYNIKNTAIDSIISSGETIHFFTDYSLKPVNLKKYNSEIFNLLNKNTLLCKQC